MSEAERQDARKAAKKAQTREILTPEMLVREHASAVLGLCITHVKNFHDGDEHTTRVHASVSRLPDGYRETVSRQQHWHKGRYLARGERQVNSCMQELT